MHNSNHESEGIANFSLTFHRKLCKQSIVTCPCSSLQADEDHDQGRLRKPHRVCFPWAVIEIKRDQGPRSASEYCSCQAANGAAAALALQQPLVRAVFGKDAETYLFPVISFTCVGPRVKTWIAYPSYESGRAFTVRVLQVSVILLWDADRYRTSSAYGIAT